MVSLLTAFVLLSAPSQADDIAFYKQIASVDILQAKSVQSELKVTELQRIAFNKHGEAYNQQSKNLTGLVQNGTLPKEIRISGSKHTEVT